MYTRVRIPPVPPILLLDPPVAFEAIVIKQVDGRQEVQFLQGVPIFYQTLLDKGKIDGKLRSRYTLSK